MAAGFKITDVLNQNSKAGQDDSPKARFRTKDVSIFKIYRNEANFYEINDIEDLASKILMSGLMENLVIVYDPCDKGEYRLISGERRWESLKLLVSQGYKEFELVTCQIRAQVTRKEESIELIISNSHRVKSIRETLEETQKLKENLEYLRDNKIPIKGYDLTKGRLRDIVASMLQTNKTKIGQIDKINKSLIPEFLEETKSDRITFSAADQLAGLPEAEQKELYNQYKETGSITYTEVKEIIEQDKQEEVEGQIDIDEYPEYAPEEPKSEPEEDNFSPDPDYMTSRCYSCSNWDRCDKRDPSVTNCNDFKDRNRPNMLSDREEEEKANSIKQTSTSQPIKQQEESQEESKEPTDRIHPIKLATMYYEDELNGTKPFTLRKNDRDFKVGDILQNEEYNNGEHTGRSFKALITSMLEDYTGLTESYCILGFRTIQ
jgi:ParB family chromosome partitioning protein